MLELVKTLAVLILDQWLGRTSWKWEHVEEEAVHHMTLRNQRTRVWEPDVTFIGIPSVTFRQVGPI
jgi:hypothetical protein